MTRRRTVEVREGPRVPLDGLVLGWGPMLPFPAAVLAVWFGGPAAASLALFAVVLWGGAILVFLAGVRRGLSFRTEGGPRLTQLAMFAWLFWAGLIAMLLPVAWALALLLAGYLSLMLLDPVSARAGETPLYFARLRPWQMAVPVASLVLLLVLV